LTNGASAIQAESTTSVISELRQVKPRARSEASTKKRKVQDESSGSNGQSGLLLKELQRVYSQVGSSEKEMTIKPASATSKAMAKSTSSEKVAPTKTKPGKTPKAPAKKVVKTAAAKRAEEEAQKRDLEATQARLRRMTDKIKADREAEKKATREAREQARQDKEKKTRRRKEPSPIAEDVTAPSTDDSDDEEPFVVKRKKAKPADWDFRIGSADPSDEEEGNDATSISTFYGGSMDCKSPDVSLEDTEESSSLHYNRAERAQERESDIETNLGKSSSKKHLEVVTIDLTSDEATPPPEEPDEETHDGANMDVSFYQDEVPSEHFTDDSFFADQGEDIPLDWHQEDEVQQDLQEDKSAEDTLMDAEEPANLAILQNESARQSPLADIPIKSDDEKPLFQAPPSSLSAISFKRDRLDSMEDESVDFDADYLDKLLNDYD